MAKPKPNDAEPVSLFPFLSILACLIGVLTFIITGVAISQMDQSEDLAAVERTEKYAPLLAKLEADQMELARLDTNYAAQQQLEEQIDRVRAQIKTAEQQIARQQQRDQVRARAQTLAQQLKAVNNQISTIQPQLKDLRDQIKADQIELDKRIEAGKPAGTVVRPSGSGVNLKPHFIECTPKHLVLYTGGKQTKVEVGKFAQSKAFLGLLDRVAKQDKERVIFLIRDGSMSAYNAAARIARERQCRYGKIPVPGEGPLDLSMFD